VSITLQSETLTAEACGWLADRGIRGLSASSTSFWTGYFRELQWSAVTQNQNVHCSLPRTAYKVSIPTLPEASLLSVPLLYSRYRHHTV